MSLDAAAVPRVDCDTAPTSADPMSAAKPNAIRTGAGIFDLEVESLTTPRVWLTQMDALMNRSRALQQQSQKLIAASRALREECVVARQQSQELRRKIAERRSKPEFF